MKIAIAQLNYHIGDFEMNAGLICAAIEKARLQQAELIIFAELAVCGYPPRDFLEFDDFIRRSENTLNQIAASCVGIAAVVGAPSVNHAEKGKPLFNSAYFLRNGVIEGVVHKSLLPNYDVFDEYRYFEPNRLPLSVVEHQGLRMAVTICEDLWNIGDDPLYIRNPMDELITQKPDLIINIAASPFHYRQTEERLNILSRNAIKYNIPLLYVNQVGGQTELIFDGGSMVIGRDGSVIRFMNQFAEDFYILDTSLPDIAGTPEITPALKNSATPAGAPGRSMNDPGLPVLPDRTSPFPGSIIGRVHDALVLGIRDYFRKMGFSKAILGLSGGIDSAVTLVLAAKALGASNTRAVLLPSQFSSDHSIADAVKSASNLGTPHDVISIQNAFETLEKTLEPFFHGLPFNITEENMQARLRAVILMALSNKFGYILLNTSNKSEAAVGYGTLYGDMCGGLSVLGDVYKTQVYQLARYINRDAEIIPVNSIVKPPSAELRPGQKDSDSLPEYDILDEVLYNYIELRMGSNELISKGFDEAMIRRILKLVNTSEYKRYQTPPILRVSPKAFGMGRRMPIVGKYLS